MNIIQSVVVIYLFAIGILMGEKFIKIDKVYHFVISYSLLLTFSLVLSLAVSVAVVFLIGVLKEIYDYHDYGLFDVKDLAADAAGISAGVLIIYSCSLLAA